MSLNFLKKPTTQEIKTEVRTAIAQAKEDDRILEQPQAEIPADLNLESDVESDAEHTGRVGAEHKLSRLVDDDFPFDESQLSAIDGMIQSPYACLTGAAGTGKTTTTKKLVDSLLESTSIGAVDLSKYWRGDLDDDSHQPMDEDDDYEVDPTHTVIPSVAMCAFTGRASQQIKRNFPRDWHSNIMTIHRLLGFYPEPYEDWDPEWENPDTGVKEGRVVTKRRFIPTYTADFRLPWDIILIDEAGMLGLDLWHQLWAACKPGCRIYMIGDINQLPPVHGKSVFGFALAKWPSFELTHVHRQQGKNNPIVDNAWRIIHGQMPQTEGRFQMIKLEGDASLVSRKVRAIAPKLMDKGIYDPIRDTIITPINGEDGAKGYALGQLPLNREFALMFNSLAEHPRYIIDGGRVKQRFAVGDKVMATKNDWEAGITNGMTGIITNIAENGGYAGDRLRYGTIEEVTRNLKLMDDGVDDLDEAIDLETLSNSFELVSEGNKGKKEKRERGPASHIVTVKFGVGEHAFEIPFATLAEVGSLMTAYVVTCHKMQGGESPTVLIICHDAHRAMLYREWLYTAVTRASEMCILLYSETALKVALNKQNIKGRSLKEKIKSFNEMMTGGSFESAAKLVTLPDAPSTGLSMMERDERVDHTPARLMTDEERSGGLASLVKRSREKMESLKVETKIVKEVHVHVSVSQAESKASDQVEVKDGGQLHAIQPIDGERSDRLGSGVGRNALAQSRFVSQTGAVRALVDAQPPIPKLLTHQPSEPTKPEEAVAAPKPSTGLSFLKSKTKG